MMKPAMPGTGLKKAVCFTVQRPVRNNTRYASLFPRLERVVRFYTVRISPARLVGMLQGRLWNLSYRKFIYPAVLSSLARRYETLFTVDMYQIPYWSKNVVLDMDDPCFIPTELELLNLPQVKRVVVTTERIKQIYKNMGIRSPISVIPQGTSVDSIDTNHVEQIRKQYKGDDLVIGYPAPRLTLRADGPRRGKEGLNDVDLLLEAVEQVRRHEPHLAVWLLGTPSPELRRYAAQAPWVKLFGYVPPAEVQNYIKNFDIGAYPRTLRLPEGRFAVKIAQYMACGIPILATDMDECTMVEEIGCGFVTLSQESFTDGLVRLVHSAGLRTALGSAGKKYAVANLDWNRLVPEYQKILMGN